MTLASESGGAAAGPAAAGSWPTAVLLQHTSQPGRRVGARYWLVLDISLPQYVGGISQKLHNVDIRKYYKQQTLTQIPRIEIIESIKHKVWTLLTMTHWVCHGETWPAGTGKLWPDWDSKLSLLRSTFPACCILQHLSQLLMPIIFSALVHKN